MNGQQTIDAIKENLESGLKPKQIAEKYNISRHTVSAIARLFDFKFSTMRDPYEWRNITGNSKHFGFSAKAVKLENKITRFHLLSIDEKRRHIVIEYQ